MKSKKVYVQPTLLTMDILSDVTATLTSPDPRSDIRLKKDIEFVGRSNSGYNLYSYRYIWSAQRYVGVMAQEVQASKPEAVVKGEDGFLRVQYRKLGLKLQTWENWNEDLKTIH